MGRWRLLARPRNREQRQRDELHRSRKQRNSMSDRRPRAVHRWIEKIVLRGSRWIVRKWQRCSHSHPHTSSRRYREYCRLMKRRHRSPQ